MSHKLDPKKTLSRDPTLSELPRVSHPLLLADDGTLEPIEVELVEHPVEVPEPQFEALVADAQCEV